jgi:hypothetical protein
MAGQLIREAVGAGAWLGKACEVLEIAEIPYKRWGKSSCEGDARHGPRGGPANSLSTEEGAEVVSRSKPWLPGRLNNTPSCT